nr:immunoglobulin heavy chain junction region [Macaca mulatta]
CATVANGRHLHW